MDSIEWPWQYSFPPFFTIQPNEDARKKQLEAWKSLVLEYYRSKKQYILDLKEAERTSLFNNTSINRKLSTDGILTVLESLQKSGNAEPINKERTRWYIYWNTLTQWGALVHMWAQESGLNNSVCTIYEIINTPNQEFTGIDEGVLMKSLKKLQMNNKAEIITLGETNGVKFF